MNEAIAHSLTILIQYLGATPVLLFFAVIIVGPMISVVWVVYKLGRMSHRNNEEQDRRMREVFERQDKRFEQVVRMYEDNVALVNNYERYVGTQQDTNNKLIDLVSISTATQQTLVDYIRNNWWCPMNRDPRENRQG